MILLPGLSGEEAKFSWGPLGGKRDILVDSSHLYYLNKKRELVVVSKSTALGLSQEAPAKLTLRGLPAPMRFLDENTICIGNGFELLFVDIRDRKKPPNQEKRPPRRGGRIGDTQLLCSQLAHSSRLPKAGACNPFEGR